MKIMKVASVSKIEKWAPLCIFPQKPREQKSLRLSGFSGKLPDVATNKYLDVEI